MQQRHRDHNHKHDGTDSDQESRRRACVAKALDDVVESFAPRTIR